jgi:hypothetical protein
MAVRADDLALRDLGLYGLPGQIPRRATNVEGLLPHMVELEDQRVWLTAVDTRVFPQVLDESDEVLLIVPPTPERSVPEIALAICRVVGLLVVRAARSAIGVTKTSIDPSPREVILRLESAASSALSWHA